MTKKTLKKKNDEELVGEKEKLDNEKKKKRKPLKNQAFKHAKLIPLKERYGSTTPVHIELENESEAEILDEDIPFPLRRQNFKRKMSDEEFKEMGKQDRSPEFD